MKKIVCLIILAAFLFGVEFVSSTVNAAELGGTNIYEQRRNILAQRKLLDDAIRQNPDDAVLYVKRGDINIMNDTIESVNDAQKDYDRALKLRPNFSEAYRGLGDYFRALAKHTKTVMESPQKMMAIQQYMGYSQSDFSQMVEERTDAALFAYSMAIDADKENNVDFYIARGDAYKDMNNSFSAIADYTSSIEKNKDYFLGHLKRGMINFECGYDQQGIVDCSTAIDILQKHSPDENYKFSTTLDKKKYINTTYGDMLTAAYVQRGTYYARINDNEKALHDYNEAVKISPDNTEKIGLRAEIYEKMGQNENAIADYSEIVRLIPSNTTDIGKRVIRLANIKKRAKIYEKMNQYDKAIADYDSILAVEPKAKAVKEARKEAEKAAKEYAKSQKKQGGNKA